ncbi:MAG TPA: iron-containing alcohol dehydrogenase [Vicinamibacterales bacterium]|nr:iron-containing alcohol dehydrogenase [Vicinamibacterales bacterium]
MRIVFGDGSMERLGVLARELGFSRTLIVADQGIVAAGFVARAARLLESSGIVPAFFHDFDANPDAEMVERGRIAAAAGRIDSIIALGGGSSLDCAKGINFVLTNGGSMRDYRGHGKASKPMLASIGIPTTAGTGSDAQSYALISDAETHAKMACGDEKAKFRVVILDPELTVSQPRTVTAIAGYDALSHAVEAFVTKTRTAESAAVAREAWQLLEANYECVLEAPGDLTARGAMLRGANRAGAAIEMSMLGAAHACANPLTARYGTIHGVAIAVMLPHVVRWNAEVVGDLYAELAPGLNLPARLDELARAGRLPRALGQIGASRADFESLAADAETQWTGKHNPRPLDARAARALYEAAL